MKKPQYEQMPMLFPSDELLNEPTRKDYEVWLLDQIEQMGTHIADKRLFASVEIYWGMEHVIDRACLGFNKLTPEQADAIYHVFNVTESHLGYHDFFWVKLPTPNSDTLIYESHLNIGDVIRLNENFFMSGKPYRSGGKNYTFPCIGDSGVVTIPEGHNTAAWAYFEGYGASGIFPVGRNEYDLIQRKGSVP